MESERTVQLKIGVNGLLWSTQVGPAEFDLLPRLRAAGFDIFEIPMFVPREVPVTTLTRALDANQLDRTVCAILPAGLSPISSDASVRAKTLVHLKDCVRTTSDLGASLIAGPLYAPVGYLTGQRRTDDELKLAVNCFQSLTGTLDENSVTLALEPLNRFETFFLNTAAEGRLLCNAIGHPRIGLLLDTFHANIEEKEVAASFAATKTWLRHIHISENDRGIPGSGHVNFPAVLTTLHEMGYAGSLVIESFGYHHPELAAATAIWRDLAPTPEAIAFEGIRYLKTLVA